MKTIQFVKKRNYQPNIRLYFKKKNYIVKTAENEQEMTMALRLRHEVFYEELLHKKLKTGYDRDRFDDICDHLCVFNEDDNTLIGTYRLNSSRFNRHFYSSTEFSMKNIIKLSGHKLELGRACVHKDHRNALTIMLLWQGIREYARLTDSVYLFGCSSIKTTDMTEIMNINTYLNNEFAAPSFLNVKPKGKFKLKKIKLHKKNNNIESMSLKETMDKIPSLLNAYLKAGAYICGEPALDKDFKCIDYLTLLPVNVINRQFERKLRNEP